LRNILKLMIVTSLIFAVAFSGCLGGDTANNTTTETGFEKEIKLSENNTVLTLIFNENPTTGYGWALTESQTGVLNKRSDTYDVLSDASGASAAPALPEFTHGFTQEKHPEQ